MADTEPGSTRDPIPWRMLSAIVVLGLLVRGVTASFVSGILYLDTILFDLESIRSFARGEYAEGLRHWVPALYPFLVSLPERFLQDIELSGRITGVVCGALTIIPCWGIARELGAGRWATIAAFLMALQPFHVRFSARISSHAPYVLFAAFAIWAGLRFVRDPRPARGATFGLACAVAYWLRQEITALPLVTCVGLLGVLLVSRLRHREDPSPGPLLGGVALAGVLFLAGIFPLVWLTHAQTGKWVLSSKGGVSLFAAGRALNELSDDRTRVLWETQISTMEDYQKLDPFENLGKNIGVWAWHMRQHFRGNLPRVAHYPILLLAALALVRRRTAERSGLLDLYACGFSLFNIALLSLFYDSPRLLLSIAPLITAGAAVGIRELAEWPTKRRWHERVSPWLVPSGRLCFVLVLLTAPFLYRTIDKFRNYRTPVDTTLLAAARIQDLAESDRPVVMDPTANVAFYAGALPAIFPNHASAEDTLYYAKNRSPRVEFIALPIVPDREGRKARNRAVQQDVLVEALELHGPEELGLDLVGTIPAARGPEIRIYRVR